MTDNWFTDFQQNRTIRGLQEDLYSVSASLASTRSSHSRLRAELSKVSGSMEQRLNRLSAAFDAFVELSDLRVTLGLFDEQGRARHHARQLFAGTPIAAEVSDVDGYWLPPALVALRIAVDGVAATDSLELATARDAHRAAVLHVLGTAVLGGRETVPAGMLATALPELPAAVPHYQRAVWTLAADGFFGEAGWELIRRRGVDFLRGLAEPERAAAVDALRDVAVPRVVAQASRKLDGAEDIAATLQACEKLTALREWVEEGLAGYTNEPAPEVDPLVRQSIELLVDEGSPVELPLLVRERELRAVIESSNGTQPSTWDSPVGETVTLLRTDVADAEHPGRRALAVRVCADHILAIADGYAETARRPVPAQVPARTRRGVVTISASGPEPASLRQAMSRIDVAAQVSNQSKGLAYLGAGVGLVFLVLAVVAGWGWGVVALAALGFAAGQWRANVREHAEAARTVEYARDSLGKELDQLVERFAELRTKLTARQDAIVSDLAALRSALS